jgi:hypothetical protein
MARLAAALGVDLGELVKGLQVKKGRSYAHRRAARDAGGDQMLTTLGVPLRVND